MEKDILESKTFRIVIFSIGGLIVLGLVFGTGVYVGSKRAEFSFQWAEDYHRNFGGPSGGFIGNISGQDFTNANGVFGQIIEVASAATAGQTILTVRSADNLEKTILVGDRTTITLQRKNIKVSDLDSDDNVVVIGSPNNSGQIVAQLIRVIPPAPVTNSK